MRAEWSNSGELLAVAGRVNNNNINMIVSMKNMMMMIINTGRVNTMIIIIIKIRNFMMIVMIVKTIRNMMLMMMVMIRIQKGENQANKPF